MRKYEKQMKGRERNYINIPSSNNNIDNYISDSKYKCSNGRRWNNKKSRRFK